eukprot:scaffold3237_cov55-Attheya_sp.AAC.3
MDRVIGGGDDLRLDALVFMMCRRTRVRVDCSYFTPQPSPFFVAGEIQNASRYARSKNIANARQYNYANAS